MGPAEVGGIDAITAQEVPESGNRLAAPANKLAGFLRTGGG
jgi:hypothetical protein